eukprot:4763122-Prymnesium_polylepis.1
MDDFFSADIHGGNGLSVRIQQTVLGEVALVMALIAEYLDVGALAVDVSLRVAFVAELAGAHADAREGGDSGQDES